MTLTEADAPADATVIPMPFTQDNRSKLVKAIQQILAKLDKRKRPPPFYDLQPVSASFELDDTIDNTMELRRLLFDFRSADPSPYSDFTQDILNMVLPYLEDLILNDCRFTVANPRPFRPPCTLQTLMLDIALILVKCTCHPPSLYRIGLAVLPAFDCFPHPAFTSIKVKLATFFVESLLPKLIHPKPEATDVTPLTSFKAPVIHVQSPDDPKARPSLTIDTSAHASSSSLISHPSQIHQDLLMYQDALFPPLLSMLLQYLALPCEDNTMPTLYIHRALRLMVEHKPELFLDLLQIIACSPPSRYHACQVLFQYYFVSLGHLVVAKPLLRLLAPSGTTRTAEPTSSPASAMAPSSPSLASPHQLDPLDDMNDHVWYPHMFLEQENAPQHHAGLQQQKQQRLEHQRQRNMHRHRHPNAMLLTYDGVDGSHCAECFQPIYGFGLRCYQCKRNIHYSCYMNYLGNDDLDIMLYIKKGGMQKVVSPQFCHIPLQSRYTDLVNGSLPIDLQESLPATIQLHGHQFQLVNLFTLLLCACCRLPLWGIHQQGYRCFICSRFVHLACLSNVSSHQCQPYQPFLETETRITMAKLEESLHQFYQGMFPRSLQEIQGKSFEQVTGIAHLLTLQRHLFYHGMASGCLLLDGHNPLQQHQPTENETDPEDGDNDVLAKLKKQPGLGLFAEALNNCHHVLDNNLFQPSPFFADYDTSSNVGHQYLLSFEGYISHLGACMKALRPASQPASADTPSASDSLDPPTVSFPVSISPPPPAHDAGYTGVAQEQMTTHSMISWMMNELHIDNRKLCEIFLQHMRNLGLFERWDASPVLFPGTTRSSSVNCIFPVPFAMDHSIHVDTLLNAIDACLDDVDLSVNECGLLMLTRRCWPDPIMSPVARQQLMTSLLDWLLSEDEKLTSLYAAFAMSQQIRLPGAKAQQNSSHAPLSASSDAAPSTSAATATLPSPSSPVGPGPRSTTTGNLYVTTRQALRDRFVAPWFAKLHELDPPAFAQLLHHGLDAVIEKVYPDNPLDSQEPASPLLSFDVYLSYLAKLKSMGLTFTALDTVLEWQLQRAWCDPQINLMLKEDQVIELRVLSKLFSGKPSLSTLQNRTNIGDITSSFDIIANMLTRGESVERAISMLNLVVHMGTGIPSVYLAKFARNLVQVEAPISMTGDFIELIWFQLSHGLCTTPRAVIIDVIGYLNETAFGTLKKKNETDKLSSRRLQNAQKFIKYSLVLTGYAYGCSILNLKELDIVPIYTYATQDKTHSIEPELKVDNKSVVIRCILAYMQWDQLNVRQEIVKLFYGLVTWGSSNVRSAEFITSCMPRLIEAVWELLSPLYDDSSDQMLQLLMKLLQIDAVPFHACVYKVMNDNNWEIRYQGLDQLYGLFTKMDAGFQSKWLPLLAKLGPVFSTLVASLWDNNENARIKATALLQSFGTLHLNSAFRCWEAHFYSASDSELRSLVHMMIRLHSLFPDWQVLQWECLLESLETKITMLASSKETHPSNSSARDTKMDPIQLAESENVTVLMMTLALQMLSHHVRIDMVQISRLKLVLVTMMGFQHPHRVLDGGEWKVLFGPIDQPFQDDKSVADPLQTSILTCCSRGLKLIMDSFAPLPAETVAKMDSKALQHNRLKLAENSSPGVHFIDVVLKYFHTDLTDLNPITLRTWLEVILIVIYKHNILDRAYEQDLVFAMKQVIDLVLHEIGEENKLLVLEILHCLLRQSDHLTAMVLSKQIVVLGKLMAQAQRKRSSDPVFLRAKQFLKAAFSRFAAAGLFVLIFKNQTITEQPQQTDLFFVLRSIIDADDKVPDEDPVVYLRDQPVRDVIDKLMKQHQMDRKSFSAVLCNMSRYVQTVHSYPYPENVLADYAGFLQLLVKYTQNWRRFDWDINPLFTMSAILLMEHPYHFQTLLPAMQVLFVHGIRHCTIQAECAVHMVASFASLENIPGIPATNIFADTIVDEIRLALTQRLKLPKDTLLTALQLVLWDSDERYHPWYISIESNYLGASVDGRHRPYFANRLDPLLDPMLSYLKSTPYTDQFTKKDFKTYNTVAHILSWKCLWSDQAMDHVLSTIHLDETRSSLRFLSWFLLCHLKQSQIDLLHRMEGLQTTLTEFLIQLFDAVQIPYGQPDPGFVYSHTGEVLVLAFLLLKIWTLVILRTTRVELLKHHQECLRNQFWISVWPSIRRLLCSIPIDTLVSGHAGLTVWTWFLSLVQFLHMCRSDAIMTMSFDWCSMLDHLLIHGRHLDDTGSGQSQANEMVVDQFQHQVVRVRQMFNVPPIQVPMHTLVDQLYLELRQVMRLQATSNTSALDDWDASGFGTAVGNID